MVGHRFMFTVSEGRLPGSLSPASLSDLERRLPSTGMSSSIGSRDVDAVLDRLSLVRVVLVCYRKLPTGK